VRIAAMPWSAKGRLARVLAYVRALPWIAGETRRADALYVFLPSHLGLLFVAAARLLGRPYGVYLRGALHLGTGRMRRALAGSRFVLATTSLLADIAQAEGAVSDVVTPMIDLRYEDVARELRIVEEPPFRILFVGRIEASKGVPEMLEGLARARRRGLVFQLDLAGSGPEIAIHRARASELGLGDAAFHGMVRDRAVLAGLFRNADLLLLPTHIEGFPRVLYEAMTYGVPVVTTFVGGIPSIMREGENCVRIPVKDAEAIAETVEKTLMDSTLRQTIANGGLRVMRGILDSGRPTHARQVMERLAP
jgi:glycosyltransferase involved in cell wall biosynthesis